MRPLERLGAAIFLAFTSSAKRISRTDLEVKQSIVLDLSDNKITESSGDEVRTLILEAALQHRDAERCELLVKRGAPMRKAATASFAQLARALLK